jgi:hypothetical protein
MRIFVFMLMALMLPLPPVALSDEGKGTGKPHNASEWLNRMLEKGGVPVDNGPPRENHAPTELEKALQDLLAKDENHDPTATPDTMQEFIKKHLSETQSEENRKKILETILSDKNWSLSLKNPAKTFMAEILKLSDDAEKKALSTLEKIDASVLLKAIGSLPKSLQHGIVERSFQGLKEGQNTSDLARAVFKTEFTLTPARAQLLIDDGADQRAVLKQFLELVPDAKKQVFSWMKEKDGSSQRSNQIASFVSLLKNGEASFSADDSERFLDVLRHPNSSPSNKTYAFQALEVIDKDQSEKVFSQLSNSHQISDRIIAARLLAEEDKRRTEILSGAVASASPEQLLEIERELPRGAELALKGSVEELKTIFEKGKQMDDSFGLNLMGAALKGLGKTAKAKDLLPFLQQATSEMVVNKTGFSSPALYGVAVDIMNERPKEDQSLFKELVKKLFTNLMDSIDSDQANQLTLIALEGSIPLLQKYPELIKANSTQLTKSLVKRHNPDSGCQPRPSY